MIADSSIPLREKLAARYRYIDSLSRPELLKLFRTIGISAHGIKDHRQLVDALVAHLESLNPCDQRTML